RSSVPAPEKGSCRSSIPPTPSDDDVHWGNAVTCWLCSPLADCFNTGVQILVSLYDTR
ncbi:hypothetical protein AVEN_179663-1, partial [Araneus ventricosus]